MKYTKLRILLIFSFILVAGLLTLPQFKVEINGTEYTYPNINLSLLGFQSTSGDFRRSTGIVADKEYTFSVTFDANIQDEQKSTELQNLLKIIQQRIEYSYLYDVKAYSEITNGSYYIKLDFPEYYTNAKTFANYLTASGQIFFSNDTQVTETPVNLTVGDIQGQILNLYDIYDSNLQTTLGNVLEFKFKDSKASDLISALSNTKRYFLMSIDGTLFAVITNPGIVNSVKAIPFVQQIQSASELSTFLNIARSYFLQQPLFSVLDPETNLTSDVKPLYLNENKTFLALIFILSAAAIFLTGLVKLGNAKGIKFGLMLASFVTLYVAVLKLGSAALSIELLIGFILTYLIAIIIIWNLLKIDDSTYKSEIERVRNIAILLIALLFVVIKFNSNLFIATDFIGAIITGMFALFIMCIYNFKEILLLDFKVNVRIKVKFRRLNLPFRRKKNEESK